MPLQHKSGFKDDAMKYDEFEPDKKAALKRLTGHWQKLGFEAIGKTGFLGLNTAFQHPEPKLRLNKTASVLAKARKPRTKR